MTRKLRILHVNIQPVVIWDDGTEIIDGPQLSTVSVPFSKLEEVITNIPAQISSIEEKILKSDKE